MGNLKVARGNSGLFAENQSKKGNGSLAIQFENNEIFIRINRSDLMFHRIRLGKKKFDPYLPKK
jgi:hypothetical protein